MDSEEQFHSKTYDAPEHQVLDTVLRKQVLSEVSEMSRQQRNGTTALVLLFAVGFKVGPDVSEFWAVDDITRTMVVGLASVKGASLPLFGDFLQRYGATEVTFLMVVALAGLVKFMILAKGRAVDSNGSGTAPVTSGEELLPCIWKDDWCL